MTRQVDAYYFKDDGAMPNHPAFPALVYRGALAGMPGDTERIFNRNGWVNSWTNGVYGYHHYHSNAHEVLGVIGGTAELQLGGEHGERLSVRAGDVIALPAGTGHKRVSAGPGFRVVGAYPAGSPFCDLLTGRADERPQALARIRQVPVPAADPVFGSDGPLLSYWR